MSEKKFKKKPWSKALQEKYIWLYNHTKTIYPDAEEDTYIDKYKRHLLSIIEKNKKWGDGSKEGLYFMVARWLYNEQDRYSKTYSDYGFQLIKKTAEKEGHNELDEKEELYFRPHEYFVNVLNSVDVDSITTKEEHYKYLLLSMLTYQPPLRTSFYNTAKMIRLKDDNNGEDNYVLISRRGKVNVTYIVNKDKASNYKLYNINKNLAKIELEDEPLEKLINESYIQYPREWLFEKDGKPISQNTLLRWLRQASGVSGITFDIMRSSYITWFYSENLNFGSRDKLSKVMRHSTNTAAKNYNKVFDVENEPTLNPEYNQVNVELELKIKELENKLSSYQDTKESEKHFKKKRRDILYNLNTKGRTGREETLKKYDIKYDSKNEIYV